MPLAEPRGGRGAKRAAGGGTNRYKRTDERARDSAFLPAFYCLGPNLAAIFFLGPSPQQPEHGGGTARITECTRFRAKAALERRGALPKTVPLVMARERSGALFALVGNRFCEVRMNGTGALNAAECKGGGVAIACQHPVPARQRRSAKTVSPWGSAALCGLFALGCAQSFPGLETPLDRPNYPTGLALEPAGDRLAVISSNSDLGYARGALLIADLTALDAFLANETSTPASMSDAPILTTPYQEGIYLPSFGGKPTFSANGENLFVATREENQLHQVGVAESGAPVLQCAASATNADGAGDCGGSSDRNLSIPGNDPYSVALLRDEDNTVEGLVSSLLSTDLVLFRYDVDDNRLRQRETFALNALVPLDTHEAKGVRALTVVRENDESAATAFALVELSALSNGDPAVELWWFSLDALPPNQVQKLSLTELTGARSAMDLAWVPSQNALLVLLREPDSIARFELSAPLPDAQPKLSALREICDEPVTVRVADLPLGVGRTPPMGYVTCYGEHAIVSVDALTLRTLSALRFAGYGPFDLVLQAEHEPPRAFVSFFLDDSIGVLDLVRDGTAGLYPRARLGNARPQPERGTR